MAKVPMEETYRRQALLNYVKLLKQPTIYG
jgi:hypothetical protein